MSDAQPPKNRKQANGPPPATPPPSKTDDTTLLLILCYLWILALVPLLAKEEDPEVQWHAKNGLLFTAAEVIFWIVLTVLQLLPLVGVFLGCGLMPLAVIAFTLLHLVAIIKAIKGQRFKLPVISDFADRWQ